MIFCCLKCYCHGTNRLQVVDNWNRVYCTRRQPGNTQDRQQVADTEMLIQTQRGCGRILTNTVSPLGGAQARSTAGHWWHSRSNCQTKESRGNLLMNKL